MPCLLCFAGVTAVSCPQRVVRSVWSAACGRQRVAGYRGGVAQQTADAPAKGTTYPGKDLGLPEQGSMSVASMGRRLLALIVDWLLCLVIARWLTHSEYWTLAVFAGQDYLLTAMGGITI